MEINDILSKLGLDLSNPEARRGALEAIDAILSSRAPIGGSDLGGTDGLGGTETEVELDPDLLQPSVKQTSSSADNDDIEIEDEENILDQIKHKESEDPIENDSSSDENGGAEDGDSNNNQQDDSASDGEPKPSEGDDKTSGAQKDNELKDSTEDEEESTETDKNSDDEVDYSDEAEDGEEGFGETDYETEEDEDSSDDDFGDGFEDGDDSSINVDGAEITDDSDLEDEESDEEKEDEDEEEFEFDEDDFLDDELKDSTEDEEIKTKHDARARKRERTLNAAKTALAKAQANKVSPALIRELEKSIEALEALKEAVTKTLRDISDAEFNQLINRVLDAIDACGNSGLTYSSEEERQAQVKEIKTDLAKAETQNELSAEDIAQIRKETQAIKAREKETEKYRERSRSSFKGFQEFLNSLYRAIALQVSNEETRDDTWSAISRRNSGAGVLRQGQRVNDLPNKRIPIIDFYFDTSTSWDADDIKVGMKAVSQLADMEEKGQIKLNIFYFADEVSTRPTRGTTSGWNEIVKNVIATQATNVVIMTDSDMQNWWTGPRALKYTVPGYVWYLWKNGSNAPRLPQDLKGRGGVQQFSFNIGDV
jgi:hypothetical protein